MENENKIFREAEHDANKYAARCLVAACVISILVWILNLIGFFTVDAILMNTATPIGVIALLTPTILLRFFHVEGSWIKYFICVCFVLGIAILYIGMTYHVILGWACPVLLSCHFYSPRVTKVTFIFSLIFQLLSLFLGALYGTWDANMLDSTFFAGDAATRLAFLLHQQEIGAKTFSNLFTLYYIPRVLILTVVFVLGTTLSRRTHRLLAKQQADFLEKERIGAELSVATEIQNAMLPNIFPAYPQRPEFELFASMTPSKEVGGDFYDFFLVDNDHLALVMADVSGKGVPAALFMMATKIMIKNTTTPEKTPAEVMMEVNNQLCETNENNMFVTVWFGIYEISTGKIIATNAGHEYPVISKADVGYSLLNDKHGFVVGGMEGVKYRNYEFQLEQGDALFLYTDGVLEAINHTDEGYGSDRLLAQLNRTQTDSLDAALHGVKADVDRFAGDVPQFDDITMLSIRRNI